MSDYTEPSSIVLIIGAVCMFIFIVHGLWFSGKPQNRKLKKDDQADQELRASRMVGKVRIVCKDEPEDAIEIERLQASELKSYQLPKAQLGSLAAHMGTSSSLNDQDVSEYHQSQGDSHGQTAQAAQGAAATSKIAKANTVASSVSVSVSGQSQNANTANANAANANAQENGLGIEEVKVYEIDVNQQTSESVREHERLKAQVRQTQGISFNEVSNSELLQQLQMGTLPEIYELSLISKPDEPYLGEAIEGICNEYGFIQGFIQENLKIYFVYENAAEKVNEVFRICSMESPFYFPERMDGFKTSAIALYMTLPPRGKGFAYFKALRMAAEIFMTQLGGRMLYNNQAIDAHQLDLIAAQLHNYDQGEVANPYEEHNRAS